MKTLKLELYYANEYPLADVEEIVMNSNMTLDDLIEGLKQDFAASLDTFTILDCLDATITETEGN